jgi:tetratricopeptide (TPR) repeat protein
LETTPLKPKKHFPKKARSTNGKIVASESLASKTPPRRLWLFRIFAAIAIPLLLIGGLELGLRLSGYGYPTSFFVNTKIGGKDYYVTNDRFGYRFFPPALARTPIPLRMAATKPVNTYRIFVFGESAAMGDPDPTFGAWRYLQVMLRERFPGMDFEVVCVAMTAINSHAILPIARECARHEGDVWIIYMGNNEMVGPFGPGSVFGAHTPGISLIRMELLLKKTKIGQLLDALTQRWGKRSSSPKIWGGLSMFKDHQLRSDDPGRVRAYANFKKNLEDILRAGRNAGVPVILSTVGSNLKDCAPFGSLHPADFNETRQTGWDGLYKEGVALETASDYHGAIKKFEQAAAVDPHYAELHFRAGSCELALTNTDEALRDFKLARDDDTLALRADGRIEQIIRDAAEAKANDGVYFLDASDAIARGSPEGIPGNELFYEHVHLNFDGNYLLSRAFADQVAKLLPKSIQAQGKSEWASATLCERRLAVSPWDRGRVWQENYGRVSEPPFTDQLNDVPRAKFYMAKLKELSSQLTQEARAQSRATYEEALARTPDDYCLRENFAQFLDFTGDLPEAPKEEQKVSELLPQNPMTPCIIGRLLVRLGNAGEAEKSFLRALAIRSDYVPALSELGLILANQQKTAEAAGLFRRILKLDSGHLETYLNWGFMEQCDGNLDQAVAHYDKAAELQPDGPLAHFNQAVALAAAHQGDDSVGYFRNAITMNPKFWQARYLLGCELAGEGRVEEAQAQFSQAVRIRPDFAPAHLNDGIALAKLGHLDESIKEFQTALQLNPTNTAAQQNLEVVQAKNQALRTHSQ